MLCCSVPLSLSLYIYIYTYIHTYIHIAIDIDTDIDIPPRRGERRARNWTPSTKLAPRANIAIYLL